MARISFRIAAPSSPCAGPASQSSSSSGKSYSGSTNTLSSGPGCEASTIQEPGPKEQRNRCVQATSEVTRTLDVSMWSLLIRLICFRKYATQSATLEVEREDEVLSAAPQILAVRQSAQRRGLWQPDSPGGNIPALSSKSLCVADKGTPPSASLKSSASADVHRHRLGSARQASSGATSTVLGASQSTAPRKDTACKASRTPHQGRAPRAGRASHPGRALHPGSAFSETGDKFARIHLICVLFDTRNKSVGRAFTSRPVLSFLVHGFACRAPFLNAPACSGESLPTRAVFVVCVQYTCLIRNRDRKVR